MAAHPEDKVISPESDPPGRKGSLMSKPGGRKVNVSGLPTSGEGGPGEPSPAEPFAPDYNFEGRDNPNG